MPWYWILVILSAIVGPFEAMHALNKARQRREEAGRKRREREETPPEEPDKTASDPTKRKI